MISGRRIFVSGGAGFIGSHLVERLAPQNRMVVFDNFHRDALTASGLSSSPQVEIVKGDVLDGDAVRRAVEGCDAVVLGCTEIPLLLGPDDSPLPALDSTRLLARAALREALASGGPAPAGGAGATP